MIVDTSVLLAILFDEKYADWAEGILEKHVADLKMSTINLTEVMILLKSRRPAIYEQAKQELLKRPLQFIAPDIEQAELAAEARLKYPLNLGDCFVYALAKTENSPVITLDSDFKKTDLTVIFPE
jgi:ribonuclease VapC